MIEDIFTANVMQLSWLREYIGAAPAEISDETLQGFLNDSRGSLKIAGSRALRFYYALIFPPLPVAAKWRFQTN